MRMPRAPLPQGTSPVKGGGSAHVMWVDSLTSVGVGAWWPEGLAGHQDLWSRRQIFSATLRRAERALGLAATSASEGRTGRRVTVRRVARGPQVQTGCWGGQVQAVDSTLKNDLTKRSSRV